MASTQHALCEYSATEQMIHSNIESMVISGAVEFRSLVSKSSCENSLLQNKCLTVSSSSWVCGRGNIREQRLLQSNANGCEEPSCGINLHQRGPLYPWLRSFALDSLQCKRPPRSSSYPPRTMCSIARRSPDSQKHICRSRSPACLI